MVPRSLDAALAWLAEGRRVVAATLGETVGSAPLDPGATMLVDDGRHIAGATMAVLEDRVVGALGQAELLDANVTREARGFLDEGRSALRRYSARGETIGSDLRVAIHAFATPPQMVVFGAIDFSAALARIAGEIGYRVTIVDARAAFLQSPRFSEHAEVVVSWPDV